MTAAGLLSLSFAYGAGEPGCGAYSNNNGNILKQRIDPLVAGQSAYTQTYAYDDVNRLASVQESLAGWSRSYAYDPFGNRAVTGTDVGFGQPGSLSAFDTATNRLMTTWAGYDAAGNLIHFKFPGQPAFDWTAAYDAENKQRYYCADTAAACGPSNATAEYRYDGEGRRVQKLTVGETLTYVYDAFGRLAAEYSSQAPAGDGGRFFRTTDHLGSTRLVTGAAEAVVSRRDYFPFGEEIPANATFNNRHLVAGYGEGTPFAQKFTGKERDDESGLDYFGARYMSSSLGRFTSADAPFMDQHAADPQSWNLYAYVRNNPLRYIDPTGQAIQLLGETEEDRQAELEAIRASLVNSKVADQLTITQNDDGQFFVGVEGSIIGFQKAGDLESTLGALIASETTVEFGFATSFTQFDENMPMVLRNAAALFGQTFPLTSRTGGAATNDGSITATGNIQSLINSSGLSDPQAARDGVPRSTFGEATAHELLGHGASFAQGIFGDANAARAIAAENRARARGGALRGVKGPHLKNRIGF